ncbi:MAG: signal peptidase I, partial [Verrucomicrobia bacterium]|nr:signal peptidase I [Verrucomicrobiota bacterium]
MMTIVRWFISPTVRRAVAMRRHVSKLVAAQRDILSPQAIAAMDVAIAALRETIGQGADKAALLAQMEKLEGEANKWLKPYPNAAWRENVEVFLVALAVAMAIRTFFLQPFKIPTGSMQPTLYGITHENLADKADAQIPGRLARFIGYWMNGVSYVHVTADAEGSLVTFDKSPSRFLLFNLRQNFQIGSRTYTVWFPPEKLLERAGLAYEDGNHEWHLNSKEFRAGEDIIKLKVTAGDHLFVNRITYNFRHPERGDIVVFKTRGIIRLGDQNTYYIKRLVGLGGERLQLKPDFELALKTRSEETIGVPVGHLVVNGHELSASTRHFEYLYSFSSPANNAKTLPYQENHYYGHALLEGLASGREQTVSSDSYFVMGDNTMNSSDSRYWGDFTREHVIGKSSF